MENKVILITGASRGIGRDMANTLAKEGYKVIANYNHSKEQAVALQQELRRDGIEIDIFQADISNRIVIKSMIDFIIEKYGKIDVLINNAGIAQTKLFTDITEEDFDTMMKNNLYAAFFMTQEVCKHMIQQQSGCVINISSIWGLVGGSCEVHYSMAKAGIDGMTKALAKELGYSHIRVNSIAPGVIDTEMNAMMTEEEWNTILQETPLRKKGKPQDITRCVKWLIEDEFTTGQVISPNGGWIIT